jgi:glucose-6-phosphate 1-dehydrogenase
MSAAPQSDALVFFGATGDLAFKQIFPALQALVKRGALNVPVVGVAKRPWSLDQLRARARSGCATQARVAVEKPFGRNLEPARELNGLLHQVFPDTWGPAAAERLVAAVPGGWHKPVDPNEGRTS